MFRVNKIIIFYGSKESFIKILPHHFENLTEIVYEVDKDSKQLKITLPNQNSEDVTEKKEEKKYIENFVIGSDEYAGVREHIIINFANFLAKLDVQNIFLHNPPIQISNQLEKLYEDKIEIIYQEYKSLSLKNLKKIQEEYDEKIIGQKKAKLELIQSLFPLVLENRSKPVVLLFFGKSGIGKTETAKYIADIFEEPIFRKQFSMFQNNQSYTYLFGGAHYEKSFAKDLLDRESNVLLLDEFDKAYTTFHSAFYQLFDEGIYEDQNYSLELSKSIIICTSNYESLEDAEKKLGSAIFNRFDKIIEFEELNNESKNNIGNKMFDEIESMYYSKFGIKLPLEVKERLETAYSSRDNVRQIKHLIEDTLSLYILNSLDDNE